MTNAVPPPQGSEIRDSLETLNRDCLCLSLDPDALARALDLEIGQPGLAAMIRERCPDLFAAQPVYVPASQMQRMSRVVQAVESVVALPAYREHVLQAVPAIARFDASGARGVFFGYDFHLEQGRLGLIEINTNAGGAMLNAVLARAQRASCAATEAMAPTRAGVAAFEQRIADMFRHEWRLAGKHRPLATIAIVDDAPEEQYLYPEFVLFRQLFERHGLRAVIAAPASLEFRAGALWQGELAIDLVYNRLTDFYLEHPGNAALREAFVEKRVLLTPHPQAHALYADKRRLVVFSDEAQLQALGVAEATREVLLEHVPRTEQVEPADEQRLWQARRGLFFKPVAGYGSRATYRGDKLTRRVWQDILAADYVAQAIVTPGERMTGEQEAPTAMKFDLRAYAYDGEVQWVAARLYRGQTTNFRTPGGGFAPVYSTVDASGRALAPADAQTAGGDSHASYVFLLDEAGGVHAIPHALYLAIARGQAAAPALAGRSLRLADWYVRQKDGEPDSVVNETYTLADFDADGRIDWARRPGDSRTGKAESPTAAERARMNELLFGPAAKPSPGTPGDA